MLNPIRLVNDLFSDKELSDANLRAFTEDHLLRLANNNPGGAFSTLITDTTGKYTGYYGIMTNEAVQTQIKEGTTVTKNETRATLEAKLSSLQGLVKYKFGETSAIYQEFYPQGMVAFYQAKDADFELLAEAYMAAATAHLTADFPAEVAAYTALLVAFKAAYAAQKNAISLVDNAITGKNTDRKALTVQLTKNFLTIASNYIDNPDQFDDFFDPRYLPLSDGLTTFNGTISFNTIIEAVPQGYITKSGSLYVENKGLVDLVVSLASQSGVINPASVVTIAAGQNYRYTNPLITLDRYFLNIQNNSTDQNGSWRVEIG
jgi:hypothetical protein